MLRVRTVFTGPPGTPWLSTMYGTGADQTAADNLVADVGTFWGAVDALMNTTVSWSTEPDVDIINEADGSLSGSFGTTPQTGSGASAGDLLPLVAQGLVRWRTGGIVAGRLVQGRSFIPGMTEAFATGGRPLAAALTTINTAAATLLASTNSTPQVWSRPRVGLAGTSHVITSGTGWSEFASMRSRRD